MRYCDGNSFAGNRDDPVGAQGGSGESTSVCPISSESKLVYFRGKRILDAILDTVLTMGPDRRRERAIERLLCGWFGYISPC